MEDNIDAGYCLFLLISFFVFVSILNLYNLFCSDVPEEEQAVDLLGSWVDQILANISIRIENLVLKYQSGDVLVSVSSKLLEIASSSSHPIWAKQFVVCPFAFLSSPYTFFSENFQGSFTTWLDMQNFRAYGYSGALGRSKPISRKNRYAN